MQTSIGSGGPCLDVQLNEIAASPHRTLELLNISATSFATEIVESASFPTSTTARLHSAPSTPTPAPPPQPRPSTSQIHSVSSDDRVEPIRPNSPQLHHDDSTPLSTPSPRKRHGRSLSALSNHVSEEEDMMEQELELHEIIDFVDRDERGLETPVAQLVDHLGDAREMESLASIEDMGGPLSEEPIVDDPPRQYPSSLPLDGQLHATEKTPPTNFDIVEEENEAVEAQAVEEQLEEDPAPHHPSPIPRISTEPMEEISMTSDLATGEVEAEVESLLLRERVIENNDLRMGIGEGALRKEVDAVAEPERAEQTDIEQEQPLAGPLDSLKAAGPEHEEHLAGKIFDSTLEVLELLVDLVEEISVEGEGDEPDFDSNPDNGQSTQADPAAALRIRSSSSPAPLLRSTKRRRSQIIETESEDEMLLIPTPACFVKHPLWDGIVHRPTSSSQPSRRSTPNTTPNRANGNAGSSSSNLSLSATPFTKTHLNRRRPHHATTQSSSPSIIFQSNRSETSSNRSTRERSSSTRERSSRPSRNARRSSDWWVLPSSVPDSVVRSKMKKPKVGWSSRDEDEGNGENTSCDEELTGDESSLGRR